MPTDYVLFVHGVKNRQRSGFEDTAKKMFDRIKSSVNDNSRTLKPVFFFWGDLNQKPQAELINGFKASSKWSDFWFQDFRTQQIVEFVGDAALYLSRHVGSQVVRRFKEEAIGVLKGAKPGDRLHLVTHSWGTVILFDILFAARWEDPRLEQAESTKDIRQGVREIRTALFGLQPSPEVGIPIASVHTMGSPISLFSLLAISGQGSQGSTHDLSPELTTLLQRLYSLKQKPLPWRNFAHAGDPIAYPLEGVMPFLLRGNETFVDTQDVITDKGNAFNKAFQQKMIPLLWGGDAHNSYWTSNLVTQAISEVIRSTS
ncbi:MAG: hypothetical protein HC780_07340 [Leptolyngbyaceae cyanobacterium CSU_1_3]|nr:hypothetical protein [Leptolyngbyaceae cyanobacterium CSU_1_3]